jgi:hypothetical protein
LPNYGVNSINANIGISEGINVQATQSAKTAFANNRKNVFEFGLNIGRRGLVQDGGGLKGIGVMAQKSAISQLYQSGLYVGYGFKISPILSLRAGFDAVYYYKKFDIQAFYATYQELGSSYDRWRLGGSLGAEIWMGRFSLPINYGYYLHFHSFSPTNNHTYTPSNTYWTFGARYFFNPCFALEAKQYLHRTQADFVGWTVV